MKDYAEIIKDDICFKDFIRERRIRESTVNSYIKRLKFYCMATGKTPTELIEEAEKEQDEGIKRRSRKVKRYIYDYIDKMEKNGKAPNTIKNHLETIKAFYRSYDIDIPRISRLITPSNENQSLDKLPTKNDVEKVIKLSGLRDKALILLQFSSGMGASEVRNLTYEDFLNSIEEYTELDNEDILKIEKIAFQLKKRDDIVGMWQIKRYKTGMNYITFNTPESTHAIIDYLIDRENKNKGIRNKSDYLFTTEKNKKISKTGYNFIFIRLNDAANFGYKKNGRRFLTSHILRKMFTTKLYEKGVDKLAIDWMLGHRIQPITEAYFKNNPRKLKEKYLEIVKDISFEKIKIKTVTSKEYDQILRDSKEKDDKILAMEKRMELMDNMIKEMMEKQMEK